MIRVIDKNGNLKTTSGPLPDPVTTPHGGTGVVSFTAHGILLGEGAGNVVPTAAMTNGQLLVGQTGADPLPKTASGDVTVAASGAVTIANAAVTLAKIANAAASSKLVGSGVSGSGAAYSEITLGTGLSMSGTTLNSSGGGSPGGSNTYVQFNDSGAFGGSTKFTFDKSDGTTVISSGSVSVRLCNGGATAGYFTDGTRTVSLCNNNDHVTYDAGSPGNWASSSPPTDVWVALDRIAAALNTLLTPP